MNLPVRFAERSTVVRFRAAYVASRVKSFMSFVTGGRSGNPWGYTNEANPGDWQKNITVECKEKLLAFSAVYACVSLIADDISKLRVLTKRLVNGVWVEAFDKSSPYYRLLRKPNGYQTTIQFLSLWMVSKLMYGNTYVFLEREPTRGVVRAMYILDPRRVTVSVASAGDVYYRLSVDNLSGIDTATASVPIPASEVIHDRMLCLWHPLCGVAPIVACGTSATQGLRIQNNSAKFFENMSRPSGHLSAPDEISDETAKRLKREFENNFTGGNLGRLLVTGNGLKYEPFTIPPEAAQLIEQLRWTVEDVARCFKIPPYKLGLSGAAVPLSTIGALNQEYYSQTLQIHIESIEMLLDEGIDLPDDISVELDEESLLRMDPLSRAERWSKEMQAGTVTPNEARQAEGRRPVEGGNTPYLQQQNYSLAALARRDASEDPFGKGAQSTSTQQPAVGNAADAADTSGAADAADSGDTTGLDAVEELAASLIAKLCEATHAEA